MWIKLIILILPVAIWAADSMPESFVVRIPNGYSYKKTGTTDSEMGIFENIKNHAVIRSDFGLMAGLFMIDPNDKNTDELIKIIKIKGSNFPKELQVSIMKNKIKNIGHMEMIASSIQDVNDFFDIVNSVDFK